MLFSIITVSRNHLDGLKRTHESLRAQDFNDYEWVVIDGASGDGTVGYLQTTSAVWLSEPDRGIYDAMNKGIERARGEYLIFMNAGDAFAAPVVLEKLALHAGVDFIYGDALEGGAYKHARSHTRYANGMFTHHQAMIYRRAVIGDLRYDTNYKIAADYKFTIEFIRRAKTTSCVPYPICDFEPGGISQKKTGLGRKEQFAIRRELRICSLSKNVFIYSMQAGAIFVRAMAPALYWRVRSSGKILCERERGRAVR